MANETPSSSAETNNKAGRATCRSPFYSFWNTTASSGQEIIMTTEIKREIPKVTPPPPPPPPRKI